MPIFILDNIAVCQSCKNNQDKSCTKLKTRFRSKESYKLISKKRDEISLLK
jgi:hypothetical protein